VTSAVDVVRAYHSATTHGGDHDRSRLVRFRPLDPTNRPAPFKLYPDYPLEPFADDDPLGRLLFHSLGVTRRSGTSYFRAAMSAGNLHPVEAYVIGDDASVRHYHPLQHGLTTLRPGNGDPIAIVLTGIPWRTAWKYGERGWRHLWWDSGAVAANVLALSPDATVRLQFDDEAVNGLVGVDGHTEFALAVVELADMALPTSEPLHVTAPPALSREPIEFPLITEVHEATRQLSGRLHAYSDGKRPNLRDQAIEDLILERGSTRLFRQETVPEEAFAAPMDVASDGAPLLEHLVAVHGVEGRPSASRALTQHLCYDQPLGGDSAYTVFHSADLEKILDDMGPRRYRAALFESGLAAGRLQLAAFSVGLGATGLTFFDDEVKAAFDTEAACMLVTAVGVPDYRSRPGGKPRQPTYLTGFDDLMGRLQLRMMQDRR
jgi:Nitroreductase family